MSRFSDQLQDLIKERDVKIYTLAAVSGIDRTFIHKMLKGERVPADDSVVQSLATSLLLTPSETEALMQSYRISKMGEWHYVHRKFIKDSFNLFDKLSAENNISVNTDYHHQIDVRPGNTSVYGSLEINNVVKAVIEMEASKQNGKIQIVAQPEYSFLFEYLALAGINRHDLTIDHIVCLESSAKDNSLYNLNCLRVAMPVLVAGCKYNPMCYYDNISSHFGTTSIMPYMILTSEYAVNISYDISFATVSNFRQYIELYSQIFKSIMQKTMPMVTVLRSHIEYLTYFKTVMASFGHADHHLTYAPCLLYFITEEMLHKYLNEPLPQHKTIFVTIKQCLKELNQTLESSPVQTIYFSEDGLDEFLRTGRIFEVPKNCYSPFDPVDRYRLLEIMYDAALKGRYRPVLINSNVLKAPPSLSFFSFGNSAVSFVCTIPSERYSVFTITEKSIVYAFHDFLDYLPESDMVYSPEETLAVIKYKLDHRMKNIS